MKSVVVLFVAFLIFVAYGDVNAQVSVLANQEWTSTGAILNAGDIISIQASGLWQGSGYGGGQSMSPLGHAGTSIGMEKYPFMCLIGKIGETKFYVGWGNTFEVPATGRLFLGPNEGPSPDSLADNSGSLTCIILGGFYDIEPETITVDANQEWTDTGLDFSYIDVFISISSQGTWSSGSDGYRGFGACGVYPNMNQYPFLSLIGKVGNSIFYVGQSLTTMIPENGELYLGPNDRPGWLGDNSGQLECQINTISLGCIPDTILISCSFMAGDANGDCHATGLDVTYLVRYFKGWGNPPVRRTDCP